MAKNGEEKLNILVVEDSEDDLLLLVRELKKGEFDFDYKRVYTPAALKEALAGEKWDIVISDYLMPGFSGLDALRILKGTDIDIPFILMSGKITEEMAVETLKAGAHDFISKQNLSRLNPSVKRELGDAKIRRAKKQADEEVKASETRYRMLFESSKDGIILLDGATGEIMDVNPTLLELIGYSYQELRGKKLWDIQPFDTALRNITLEMLQQKDYTKYDDLPMETKSGKVMYMEFITNIYSVYNKKVIQCSIHDITGRKRSEKAILEVNRELKVLSACNRMLVHVADESQLLHNICDIIVRLGMYRMAWVGFLASNGQKTIKPVAHAGFEENYLKILDMAWEETEHELGPIGRTLRTKDTQVSQNIREDEKFAIWRDEALKRGYNSLIALPLMDNGDIFGIVGIFAAHPNAFNPEEIELLKELSNDLAFGIISLRTRIERDQAIAGRQRYLDKLRTGLEDTIRTIASTVEMKDPYTAGHQRRVADLAVAIGEELGLSEEQIRGLHFAGIIHDVGKIRIPAEILSKPGHLAPIEMDFIKIHPGAGYELLKDIEFPWPIADIVWEHHERVDGSGYPRGLKGDEILIEAKIISVADVVESMASHRPYRAGLGMQAAMDEITQHKGTYYDPAVVDACIRLINEKDYTLSAISPNPLG